MTESRANERNDMHTSENLIDPGPVGGVTDSDAKASRDALRRSTPEPIRKK